jgi:hypothetical protein
MKKYIVADKRTYPRCAKCGRKVEYVGYGKFTRCCMRHLTPEEYRDLLRGRQAVFDAGGEGKPVVFEG